MGEVDFKELWATRWAAPAKLNLMLRIVGQRADGYHLLQTVFQFVDLCDWVSFKSAPDGVVKLRTEIEGVPAQDDLTVLAARALKDHTNCPYGVEIDVEKNVPMGGGLGGGSSDAATTLVVLNKLWQLNLHERQLKEIGLALGADVPIFVHGSAAWAEGVGEKITDISLPECWMLIVRPACHVNTKEIFCAEGLTRNSKSIRIEEFTAGEIINDCLPVVRQHYPLVGDALDDLSVYTKARLTGTGACIFGEFLSREAAESAQNSLQKKWQVFLVKTLNRSPLHLQL